MFPKKKNIQGLSAKLITYLFWSRLQFGDGMSATYSIIHVNLLSVANMTWTVSGFKWIMDRRDVICSASLTLMYERPKFDFFVDTRPFSFLLILFERHQQNWYKLSESVFVQTLCFLSQLCDGTGSFIHCLRSLVC